MKSLSHVYTNKTAQEYRAIAAKGRYLRDSWQIPVGPSERFVLLNGLAFVLLPTTQWIGLRGAVSREF